MPAFIKIMILELIIGSLVIIMLMLILSLSEKKTSIYKYYSRFSTLEPFTSSKNLRFISDRTQKYPSYAGTYNSYNVKIEPIIERVSKSYFHYFNLLLTEELQDHIFNLGIRISVLVNDSLQINSKRYDKQLAVENALNQIFPVSSNHIIKNESLKGNVKTHFASKQLYVIYEQDDTEMTAEYFENSVIELLTNLAEACSVVVKSGSESISLIKDMGIKTDQKAMALGLLECIIRENDQLFADKYLQLICSVCLTHFKMHREIWTSTKFYGCRICKQSQAFFENIKRVIATLDNHMNVEHHEENGILCVNWLKRRSLFDFDEVEIIHATDEDVERFAVQVGNDNDPVRLTLYKKMRCKVASECNLTENTLRVLRNTFGQVEIINDLGENKHG